MKSAKVMYDEVMVARRKMNAMVDAGVSQLCISKDVAGKLTLRVEKGKNQLKTVNLKEILTFGRTGDVEFDISSWQGKENIEIIPIDYFKFVIGMDFLDRIDAIIISKSNSIGSLNEES